MSNSTAPQRIYQAKHPWPPDFTQLSKADKFRLERKYKRRTRLASASPRWMMFTGLLQVATVTGMYPINSSYFFLKWVYT